MDRLLDKLKVFDAYPKTLEDFRIKTISGGIVTALSSIVMLSLFALEVHAYFKLDVRPELTVDVDRSSKLQIQWVKNIEVALNVVWLTVILCENSKQYKSPSGSPKLTVLYIL